MPAVPGRISDVQLLDLEIGTIWGIDDRGRLDGSRSQSPPPYLVIGVTSGAVTAAVGRAVPESLALELMRVVDASAPQTDPAQPPAAFAQCSLLIEAQAGPVIAASGPSFLIPRGTHFESAVSVRLSREAGRFDLLDLNPREAGWDADEWRQLIAGGLGPCAMAVEDARVVSICHCARLNAHAAEAGVWTAPEARGRGYAPAVTAAWASLFEEDRVLFYSTSADNLASRAVARKLGLREIGWLWSLRPP